MFNLQMSNSFNFLLQFIYISFVTAILDVNVYSNISQFC